MIAIVWRKAMRWLFDYCEHDWSEWSDEDDEQEQSRYCVKCNLVQRRNTWSW